MRDTRLGFRVRRTKQYCMDLAMVFVIGRVNVRIGGSYWHEQDYCIYLDVYLRKIVRARGWVRVRV